MEEKKYLKWYNKIGYGSGDIAGKIFVEKRVLFYYEKSKVYSKGK